MGVHRNSLGCKKNKLLCEACTPAIEQAKLLIILNKGNTLTEKDYSKSKDWP